MRRLSILACLLLTSACQYLPKWSPFGSRWRDDLVRVEGEEQNGPVRVYFTTPDDPHRAGNPADVCCSAIDACRTSIDVAAFELDNVVITNALCRAVDRGVKVRLVTDSDYIQERGVEILKSSGVPVVEDKRSALMHNKFMVLDGQAVWTGSMNFTENCAYKNNNHGILIVNPQVAENYATKFDWFFEDRKFGSKPTKDSTIPTPHVKLKDGTPVEIYFSTHDHPAVPVTEELQKAKKTIHFLAFSFTHKDIGGAMREAIGRGVKVGGVFEKSQAASGHSQFEPLRSLGADVRIDGNPKNMHHKLIIIDGETVIAGSFNFSSSADQSNDENLVVIRNRDIAKRCEAEWNRVMEKAEPTP